MIAPGKYDSICTAARIVTGAKGCVLVIIEGDQGPGLSVQCSPEVLLQVPAILRRTADLMDAAVKQDVQDIRKAPEN